IRIIMLELLQREMKLAKEFLGIGNRLRITAKEARHLEARLEIPFPVCRKPETGLCNQYMLANGGDHIGKRTPVRMMVKGLIGGDQRNAAAVGEIGQHGEDDILAAVIGR